MSDLNDLRRLIDIEAITQVKSMYCLLVDTKQWDEWQKLFTDDVHIEGRFAGKNPEEFADAVEELLDGVETAHHVQAPLVRFRDEYQAKALWPMHDELRFPPNHPFAEGHTSLSGYGHYEEEFRKVGSVWKISFFRLARLMVRSGEDVGTNPHGLVRSAGLDWINSDRWGSG